MFHDVVYSAVLILYVSYVYRYIEEIGLRLYQAYVCQLSHFKNQLQPSSCFVNVCVVGFDCHLPQFNVESNG